MELYDEDLDEGSGVVEVVCTASCKEAEHEFHASGDVALQAAFTGWGPRGLEEYIFRESVRDFSIAPWHNTVSREVETILFGVK
jgi:hypothetical protein